MKEKVKFGRLMEGPPKSKQKIRNTDNFAPGVRNVGQKIKYLTYMSEHIKVIRLK